MEHSKESIGLLKLLFEQPDAYKFIIGVFVLFIVPQIINIYNTIIKNKSVKDFNKDVNAQLTNLHESITIIKDRIDSIYDDNFDECTNNQIEHLFRGRVSIDIDLLIKNTKQVIVINHVDDKDTTKKKVNAFCNTVVANTKLVMNYGKRNGIPCGAFINSTDWSNNLSATILSFIYSGVDSDAKNKGSYNYETLKFHLKSQYDTFTIDYINRVNEECII